MAGRLIYSAIAKSGTSKSALVPVRGFTLVKLSAFSRSFSAASAWQCTKPRGFLSRTITASVDGAAREITKVAKDRYEIAARPGERVAVDYTVYAHDLSVRTAHHDASHAYLHPPQLFLVPEGHQGRFTVAVELLPGVRMLPDQIVIVGMALAAMLALHLFLARSRTGMAMRAMAESPALAQVCGIEVEAVVRLTWIISGALAAFAGVFVGLTPQLHPEIGFNLLLSLFAAAILGGSGSLAGAVLGGVLVGLAENLSLLVINPGYKGAMPFLLLLAILIVRPQGIFGDRS